MNAIQVKSYLFPENAKVNVGSISQVDEIRRFNLAVSGAGAYKSLVEKLQSAYGSLLPRVDEVKTYWQDDENELVGFSSDTEMQYAVDLQTAVQMSKPYESGKAPAGSSLFKVYVARKPAVEAEPQQSTPPPIHMGVVCDGCNGPVIGVRHKCAVCVDYDLCDVCERNGVHKELGHAFTRIEKPTRHGCPFMANGGGGGRRFGHCRRQRSQRCQEQASTSPAQPNPLQQSLNDFLPFLANSMPIVKEPEQLKAVGEYLKSFLDPFGIDVDYYIDTITKKQSDEKAKESKAEAATSSAEPKKRSDSLMDQDIVFDEKKEEEPVVAAKQPESTSVPTAPAREELIDLGASPFEVASNALKTIVEKKNAEEAAAAAAAAPTVVEEKKSEEANEDSGFNLVDIEKELRIIKSIEQLRSMGYSDDGGWLTRLVSAKDGNINAVLDAISPFGPRN